MNWSVKVAFLMAVLCWPAFIAGQSSIVLDDNATQRHLVLFDGNAHEVSICGFLPGAIYHLTATPVNGQHSFALALAGGGPNDSRELDFQAAKACHTVLLQLQSKGSLEREPVYLTIGRVGDHPVAGPTNTLLPPAITTNAGVPYFQLISDVFIGGNCYNVTGMTGSGNGAAVGSFANGATSIGFPTGVILATGQISNATGPNNTTGVTTDFPGGATDPDLNALSSATVQDVVRMEFDFVPTNDTLKFQYVFASEEYCDYVNSSFNDVFGFFISGPGIAGPFTNGAINIATLPGSTTPVSINNVNHINNSAYYVGNIPAGDPQLLDSDCNGHPAAGPPSTLDCQYDGFTTVLTATAVVIPCQTYHIKLAIGDAGDGAFDSAVFLKENSFDIGGSSASAVGNIPGTNQVNEGCNDGYIEFTRDNSDTSQPLTITYTVLPSSTATPGLDYAPLSGTITIPVGQMSAQLFIDVFSDGITEGIESIIIEIDVPCSCTNPTVTMFIVDTPPLVMNLPDATSCAAQSVTLTPTLSGGISPYSYQWSTGASTPSITVSPGSTQSYQVTVTDGCGSTFVDNATVTVLPAPTAAISGSGSLCASGGGSVNLSVAFTGSGPWTFAYTINGVPQPPVTTNANPYTLTINQAGTYSLSSVTAGVCPGNVSGSVVIGTTTISTNSTSQGVSCFGASDGSINLLVSGGTPTYTFAWSNGAGNSQNPSGLPAGSYSVTVTDSNGCTGTSTVTVPNATPMNANVIGTTAVTCTNPSGGSINLQVSGGAPSYTFAWSNGAGNNQNPSGLPAGSYSVTVTDSNGCTTNASANVPADTLSPLANASVSGILTCATTSLQLNGVGSSSGPGFSYQWTTTNGNIIAGGTTLTPTVDAPGAYTLTVTNASNGCTATASINVAEDVASPTAVASGGTLDCNTTSLILNGTGSSSGPGFSYQWNTSNGNIVSGANTLNATVDAPGAYTLTVTNAANGCFSTVNVNVTQNIALPTAVASGGTLTCATTSLQLSGVGSSSGPGFSYQWNTVNGNITAGGNTLTPTVDAPGTYTLTVTNANNGCTASVSVNVAQDITPPVAQAVGGTLTCVITSLQLNGVGSSSGPGFSYQWTTTNGNITAGGNTLTPTVGAPGTYTLTVTNGANGCTATSSVTVLEDVASPIANASVNGQLGCTQTSLQLNGMGSSSGPGFSYQWTTTNGNITAGGNTLTPTVDAPGTYTLTVTNAGNGCTATASVTVTDDSSIPLAMGSGGQLTCAVTQLTLNGAGSSNGPGITYLWTTSTGNIVSGANTLSPLVDAPGIYTLTVTDTGNGCQATVDVFVGQDVAAPLAQGSGGVLTCTTTQLMLNGSGSSGGPGFSYQWTTVNGNIIAGGTTLTPTVDAPGAYTLTVTNAANGCVSSTNVVVTQDLAQPAAAANSPGPLTCINPTLSLSGAGSSTGPGFSYQWTTPDGNIVSGNNTLSPTVDAPGNYTLTVTNAANGCTSSVSVLVTENVNLPVATGIGGTLTCATTSLQLNGAGSSSGPGFGYQWTTTNGNITGGANSLTPTVDAPGTYTLTVTNSGNGCVASVDIVVTEDVATPSAAANGGMLTCNVTSLTLSGTGSSTGPGFSYQWATPDGNIVSGGNTLAPTVDAPGTYTLTVTNAANGCTGMASVVVTEDMAPPSASAAANGLLTCADPTITLDGAGSTTGAGFNYQWTTSDGHIVSGGTSLNPVVDQPGTYTLTVTNTANGCTANASVTVSEDTTVPTAAATGGVLDCSNTQIGLSGTGSSTGPNITYLWTTPNGNIVAGATTLDPTVDAPGAYTLTVTNANNGCTANITVNVTQNIALPIATATAGTITCGLPQITINGAGSSAGPGFSYQWTTLDGNIVSGTNTLNPVVDQGGTYTLTVTNGANGCTATFSLLVNENTTPPVAAATAGAITCANPQITISGTGSSAGPGILYQWTTPDGHIVSGGTTLNPVVDAAGSYTLTVTNSANGCTQSIELTVQEDTATPAAQATGGVLTCLQTSLTLDGAGSATGPGITYGWTTPDGNIVSGANTLFPLVDQAGTYQLIVTNTANGCTTTVSAQVTADQQEPTAVATAPPLTCIASQVTISGAGSSTGPGFSYQWTTQDGNIVSGANTLFPTVSLPGPYDLTVTDASNGCTATITVVVLQDIAVPTATATAGTITCANPQLTIDGSGSSTGPNFSYQWTTINGNIVAGANTLFPVVDAGGTYQLTVTNTTNGCQSTFIVGVGLDMAPPFADAGPPQTLTCGANAVLLDGTNSAAPGLSYQWTTTNGNIASGGNTLTPLVDATGLYTLTVTNNANGCTATATVSVTQDDDLPVAFILPPAQLTCTNLLVVLDGSNSSTGPNYSYQWTTTNGNILGGQGTLFATVSQAGSYTLSVTDLSNQCVGQSTVTVIQNTNPPIAEAGSGLAITCIEPVATLGGPSTSTGPNFTYQWTTTNGNIVAGTNSPNAQVDQPGNYTLIVTDQTNGCTALSSTVVGIDQNPPLAVTADATLTCAQPLLQLSGLGSSGGPGITYQWTTANGNIVTGANTLTPTVSSAGSYILTVTNAQNGCSATSTAEVAQDTPLPTVVVAGGELSCAVSDLVLDGNGSSSGPDFTYLWTTTDGNILSGNTTLTPLIDAPGTYLLTVENSTNGCSASASISVGLDDAPPLASVTASPDLTCAAPTIQLNGSGSSTGPDFTYLWTTTDGNILSGETTLMPEVNASGSYLLTVTDQSNGCTAEATVVVQQAADLPQASAGSSADLTCQIQQILLDGTGSSQGPGFTYLWSTSDGNILSGNTTLTPLIDTPGAYQLQVTNTNNGCSAVSTVQIGQDTLAPVIAFAPVGPLDCVSPNVAIDASGSVAPPNATFQWSTTDGNILNGQGTPTISVDAAGAYVLLLSNLTNGCSSQASLVVTADQEFPMIDILPAETITCSVPSILLDASGSDSGPDFAFQWTTADGNLLSGADSPTPEVDAAGWYLLGITDLQNGCTTLDSVAVTADQALPVIDLSAPETLNCALTEIQLSASTGVGNPSVSWLTTDGHIVAGAQSLTPTVDAGGTYVIQLTDPANGCMAEDSLSVLQNTESPQALIDAPEELSCFLSSVQLEAGSSSSASGQLNFFWTTTDGNILSGDNTASPLVGAGGTYLLTITDPANACVATAEVEVLQDQNVPTAEAGPAAILGCVPDQLLLAGSGITSSGAIGFLWTTTDGSILSGANTPTPLVDAPGSYLLTITDPDNGCQATDVVLITEDLTLPVVDAGPVAELTCTATEVQLSGMVQGVPSAYLYEWQTADGNIVAGADGLQPLVDAAGSYTLVATDPLNGCSASATTTVVQDSQVPQAEIGPTGTLTCDQSTLILDASNSSQGANYGLSWTTTGGSILSGQNTLTPEVNAAGLYTLTITDLSNNCLNTASINVPIDTLPPQIVLSSPDTLSCDQPTIVLQGMATDTANLSISWSTVDGHFVGGVGGLQPEVDQAGFYLLSIVDESNGCLTETGVSVVQDTLSPQVSILPAATITCTSPTISLEGLVVGGPTLSFNWSTTDGSILSGGDSLVPTIAAGGTYSLLVVDADNGCTGAAQVAVPVDTLAPLADAGPDAQLDCGTPEIELDGSGSSQGIGLSYLWISPDGNISAGATTDSPAVDAPGTYVLQVEDLVNGCVAVDTVQVGAAVDLPVVSIEAPEELNCIVTETTLQASASTTSGQIELLWTTPDGNIVSGNSTLTPLVGAPGQYLLEVLDPLSGCVASQTVDVQQNVQLPTVAIEMPPPLTCQQTEVGLDAGTSSSGPGFDWQWTTPDGNIVAGANTLFPVVDQAGAYLLTITDTGNGCEAQATVNVSAETTPPVVSIDPAASITCVSASVLLTGQSAPTTVDWQWSTIDGHIVGVADQPEATVDAAGTYTLTVIDQATGCSTTVDTQVDQNTQVPTVAIALPEALTCLLPEINLDATQSSSGPDLALQWETLDGNFLSGATGLEPLIDAPGTYTLTITDLGNGCTASAEVVVSADQQPPLAEAGTPFSFPCDQLTAPLSGSAANAGTDPVFNWATADGQIAGNSAQASIEIASPGWYLLTVTNSVNGCVDVDSVSVTPAEIPAFTFELQLPDCEEPTGEVELLATGSGTPPFVYSIDGGATFQSTGLFAELPAGVYDLLLQDSEGCESIAEAVELPPVWPVELSLAEEILLVEGEEIELTVLPSLTPDLLSSISWSPSAGLSCDDCLNPLASPGTTTLYTVEVESSSGCLALASVLITVEENKKQGQVYVPNAFSPNGDGENERFFVFAEPGYLERIQAFLVFDRWGEPVFQYYQIPPNDPNFGWDGTYRGKPLDTGVYTWFAQLNLADGRTEIIKGDVLLMR